jgi:hypothetical protein
VPQLALQASASRERPLPVVALLIGNQRWQPAGVYATLIQHNNLIITSVPFTPKLITVITSDAASGGKSLAYK